MFILRRADHQHFVDDVEGSHEALRAMDAALRVSDAAERFLGSGVQAELADRGIDAVEHPAPYLLDTLLMAGSTVAMMIDKAPEPMTLQCR